MKRKTDNFNKFYNKKSNAAIKEGFRQEKKAAKKERKEAIERHFEEKRKARAAASPANGPMPAAGKPAKILRSAGQAKVATPPAGVPGSKAPAGPPASKSPVSSTDPNALPLNKYIAHGGICSRRDAADLIRLGKVQVNGQLVTEPGTKVSPDDLVKVNGKKVTISRNFVYILLNKPKDYITTTDDPQGRKTVLDLIRQATPERVFPVGRLDRNTSGVLLLTNDGDLAQKLAHPKHEIKKIYHVALDKPLTKADFDTIAGGVKLEDGIAYVDVLAYADSKDKTQIGLEIHSGRNRIVRRIFEHLGYDVRGLDRVMYAGLTKKNVQRGHWRMLTEKEIRILKYLNSSFRGSLAAPKTKVDEGEDIETPAPARQAPPKKFKKPRPSATGPSRGAAKPAREDKRPPAPNGGLRGRKSGGSYIKSKAKSQQASVKPSGARSTAPRSPRPPKPSGRRNPH